MLLIWTVKNYEKETIYGLNRQKQIDWTKKIENEIKDLGSFTQ